jgi:hypothetical protein
VVPRESIRVSRCSGLRREVRVLSRRGGGRSSATQVGAEGHSPWRHRTRWRSCREDYATINHMAGSHKACHLLQAYPEDKQPVGAMLVPAIVRWDVLGVVKLVGHAEFRS